MTNKIPKKLMRDFATIVLPEDKATQFVNAQCDSLQTIIDLAAAWCCMNILSLTIHQIGNSWVVSVGGTWDNYSDPNLSKAIMTAVVAAAKETKEK